MHQQQHGLEQPGHALELPLQACRLLLWLDWMQAAAAWHGAQVC
jgi:hypothetical protein